MRLWLKLLMFVVLTVTSQLVLEGSGGRGDELCFTIRCYCAHVCGVAPNDPVLLTAAQQYTLRQFDREERLGISHCNATIAP